MRRSRTLFNLPSGVSLKHLGDSATETNIWPLSVFSGTGSSPRNLPEKVTGHKYVKQHPVNSNTTVFKILLVGFQQALPYLWDTNTSNSGLYTDRHKHTYVHTHTPTHRHTHTHTHRVLVDMNLDITVAQSQSARQDHLIPLTSIQTSNLCLTADFYHLVWEN